MHKNLVSASIVFLLTFTIGCNNSQSTEKPVDASPTVEDHQSASNEPTESVLLKEEMIVFAVELMSTQDPNTDSGRVREQVEETIVEMHKLFPEFLIISPEAEEKLRAGTPIDDSAEKIAAAEAFFKEYNIPHSELVSSLLSQHNAGSLTPIRTELLAQLMVAEKKNAEHAMSN